jgi:hypothetical protein
MSPPAPVVVLSSLLVVGSCGSGTTLAFSGSSGSAAGDVNSPPSATDPSAFGTTTSPALVCFDLADPERDPVDVRLRFEVASTGQNGDCLLVAGTFENEDGDMIAVDAGLVGLATDPIGLDTAKAWDFASQLGPGRLEGVRLFVEVVGGGGSAAPPVNGESEEPFAIGNDPPVLVSVDVLDDDEIIPVAVTIENTGPDEGLRVKFEYVMDDPPFCDPQLARGVDPFADPSDPTPEFAIDTDTAPEDDEPLVQPLRAEEVFFWESDFPTSTPDAGCQLELFGGMVHLVVTVVEVLDDPDGGALRHTLTTPSFPVDNVATLLVTDPDRGELHLWNGTRWRTVALPPDVGDVGGLAWRDADGDGDADLVDERGPVLRVWSRVEPGVFALQ